MHHLREAAPARVEPRPVLAARRHVLGHGDDARRMRVARDRQRPADQPRGLREPASRRGSSASRSPRRRRRRCCRRARRLEKRRRIGSGSAAQSASRQQRAEPQIAEFAARSRGERSGALNAATCDLTWLMAFRFRCRGSVMRSGSSSSPGRKLSTLAPSRIAVAICGFGTDSICAYQRSIISMKAEHVLQPLARDRRDGGVALGVGACRRCSTATAGSISRSLRPAAMRRNTSQMSVSASK